MKLIETFPQLAKKYFEYYRGRGLHSDETGSHLVYEGLFVPMMEEAIISDNIELAGKCAEFTEELITSGDDYSENVAVISIIEALFYNCFDHSKIEKLLLPKSMEIWNEFDDWHRAFTSGKPNSAKRSESILDWTLRKLAELWNK
jgi:hypothetical protein